MNINDKFHDAEFEVNAQAISDENLEGVSGGYTVLVTNHEPSNSEEFSLCPYCNNLIKRGLMDAHKESCRRQKYVSTTQCS